MGLRDLQGRTLYSIMSACCGSSFMLYGYDAGVLGGIQETDSFRNAIGNPQGAFVIPIIASIYNLAAFASSMFTAFVGMKIGRRLTIVLGNVCIIIGAIIQASTFSVGQIIVGRIICGFGIGFIASAVPTYMSEMSLEAKERGPEVSKQGALLITGVALAYWIDFGFVQSESQIWNQILAAIEEESKTKFNVMLLFWDNSDYQVGRRLRTSFMILFMQQLLGINMLVYFSTTIFKQIGYDDFLSSILAAVMNTVFAISCYPPIWTIERHGRRPMMFWTALGCAICLIVFIAVTNLDHQTKALGWVAAASVIIYNIIFGYGWLGPPWVYGPELETNQIAPLQQRHIAGALGAAGEWLSTFIMVFGGGTGIESVGPKIWIFPLICCFLTMAFVYFYCPETTGKTLEEIDYLFAKPEVRERLDREGLAPTPSDDLVKDEEKVSASHQS
ncbi:hypothetical protein K4F52_003872 [Lecanicillium sp. MT-2017a]|nr:hypothetical protein K4F52_003872 [Lecanicillium sp. MT-2017a]